MNHAEIPDWLAAAGVAADIGEIVSYIRALRDDLTGFNGASGGSTHISGAKAELGEVVAATEDAANRIMDACDSLSQVMKNGPPRNDQVKAAINEIYEACSFQDLTSQRVVKVKRTLDVIESRMTGLALKLGIDPQAALETSAHLTAEDGDAWLLNGPAMTGAAIGQNDVDKLFD